eukprot:403348751
MDCELCLEEFNQQEHMPKVLPQCGHTFCEKCMLQLWQNQTISCPLCRQKARITNPNDLPQTNYALLRVHSQMKEERKAKSLIDQYRVINPKGYLEIEETINRQHGQPNQLQLYGIYDEGELIYKEAIPDTANARLKIAGQRKYCFNHNSFLTNYFFMNEQTRHLMFFRKFTFCRHKFSCFEHIIRTVYKTVGFYLIVRFGAKMILQDQSFELFAGIVRRFRGDEVSNDSINEMGVTIEAMVLMFSNFYLLRKCLYSMMLEAQAD